MLNRAFQAGVQRIITIGIDLESSLKALALSGKHPFIFSTVGYHPHNAKEVDPQVLEHYRRLKRRSGPAVVVVEGGVCQGCLMRLPSQFVQSMRRQRDQIQLCSHCKRFVYQI